MITYYMDCLIKGHDAIELCEVPRRHPTCGSQTAKIDVKPRRLHIKEYSNLTKKKESVKIIIMLYFIHSEKEKEISEKRRSTTVLSQR